MNHRPRKRFGQNFLIDNNVVDNIVHAIDPRPGDHLVEIGPGQGAMTAPLLESVGAMDVIELDRDLAPWLEQNLGAAGSLRVHCADALRFDFRSLAEDGRPLRVVGNLPYNISTPLLFHLTTTIDIIQDMHFMLQKEVVQRMAAGPGGKDYGRLSVMIQYYCGVEKLFDVRPGSFRPPPKVDSSVVRLIPHAEKPAPVRDENDLATIVAAAFNQRRKTLRNALKAWLTAEQITAAGVRPEARAETLSLEQFAALSDAVSEGREG